MTKEIEELIEENNTLKKKISKLKKENLMDKMKYEIEIAYSHRRQYLLNLLISRNDIEDMIRVLFAYLIRMLPFKKAYLTIKEEEYEYNVEIIVNNGRILMKKIAEISSDIKVLVAKVLDDKKGFLISDVKNFDKNLPENCEICMTYPIFIDETSYSVCYFENDLKESYSEKEFQVIEEILKDVAYPMLNAIEFSKLVKSRNIEIKDKNTKLYNKYYLLNVLKKQLFISRATCQPFSIIYFKILNDDIDIRNRLLKKMANYFKLLIRKIDMVFKYEQDELVILINNADEAVAETVLKRLEEKDVIFAEIDEEETEMQFGIYTHFGDILETNIEILEKAKSLT